MVPNCLINYRLVILTNILVYFAQNKQIRYDERGKTKEDTLKKRKTSVKVSLKRSKGIVKKTDKSIEILGVPISGNRLSRVLEEVSLQRREMLHIATVNPEYIMEARINAQFKSILSRCLTVADGHGVVWGARMLGEGRVERVSGTQLVEEILQHASEKGEKVFLLGAGDGIAQQAAEKMRTKYPALQIYSYSGARVVKVEKNEEASMTIAKINSISPDYLLVAYGSPWQDIWIEENRPYLRVRVAMGVGGVFDEWAGVVKLCPVWVDQLGMKWLWRVLLQPWRWKRIMRVVQFGWLVIWRKVSSSFASRLRRDFALFL